MSDRRDDTDSLDELFARALPGVVPLAEAEQPRRIVERRVVGPHARRPGLARPPGRGLAPGARLPRFAVERYGEIVTALAAGADTRWLDRLRAGAVPPEASLDLHGHSAASAALALDAFLARAAADGSRCLLVVHGRGRRSPGGPVLKEEVVRRLLAPPHAAGVVALATAPTAHGGPGALLVLLRGGRRQGSRR